MVHDIHKAKQILLMYSYVKILLHSGAPQKNNLNIIMALKLRKARKINTLLHKYITACLRIIEKQYKF